MAFASFLPVASRAALTVTASSARPRTAPVRVDAKKSRVRASIDPPIPSPTVADRAFDTQKRDAPADADMVDLSTLGATLSSMAAVLLGVYLAGDASPAFAVPEAVAEGFKSIPVSLAHPATMWGVFAACLYAFYLGWASRSIRSATPERRKELVKEKVTKRHFETAASLFAVMTCATFFGMANTFARAEKLFPGPHLYAGLGLIAAMSVMVSLVPAMQGGKLWAKNAHFALAFPVTGMFAWQAWTGMQIVFKLLKWE